MPNLGAASPKTVPAEIERAATRTKSPSGTSDRPRPRKRNPVAERLKARVPRWYRPVFHYLGNMSIAAFAMGVMLWRASAVEDFRVWTLLAFVPALILSNGMEYVMHRYPMHHRTRFLDRWFKRHTLMHHRFFDHLTLAVRSRFEAYYVMTNGHTTALSIAIILSVYFALGWAVGVDLASVVALSLTVYAAAVETMHILFHCPDSWLRAPVLRSRAFQYLLEHHRIHHDPHLMTKWNFNIAFPFFDILLGTVHHDDPAAPLADESMEARI